MCYSAECTTFCIYAAGFNSCGNKKHTRKIATDVTNKHGWTSAIISAVRHHLRTLCVKGYIERLRQGVYRKVTRRINNKIRQAA